ncbi:MAG: hypothetical protein M1837_001385 [Sclerophora amabilis]|nr:MAG: hypothetical protein M1837_001385 [Sclerophora amabilis]
MLLSSRQMPPRMSIRRSPPSYSSASAASPSFSQFNFQRMLDSPPVSPGLPSTASTRDCTSSLPRRYANLLRLLCWMAGVSLILSFAYSRLRLERQPEAVSYKAHDGEIYEIVGDDALPDYPSPVVVTDKQGRPKWTVSIPPTLDFPLRPEAYAHICTQSMDLAGHVSGMRGHGVGSHHHAGHFGYYHVDKNFMDVDEAEKHGMLPGVGAGNARDHTIWDSMVGSKGDLLGVENDQAHPEQAARTVCKTSLTFAMETSDAGMGKTLMSLWMSYGLAKKEGRAFFIDDTNWPYGKFATYFAPPPTPSCLPPPRTQVLPCPHHAKHLLVSTATTTWTFGHAFNDEFEDPKSMEVKRQKNIFALLREGHDALFHLNAEDESYVSRHISDLASQTISARNAKSSGMVVGIHVRHGDLHPLEFQYQKSYIPLYRYASAAKTAISSTYNTSAAKHPSMSAADFEQSSVLLLASDDPEVYTADELSNASRAQDKIQLASKTALDAAQQSSSTASKDTGNNFVEETIGWEGGFFRDIFWSLGSPSKSHKHTEQDVTSPSEQALKLRELVGRAYLLDLKVLGGGADAVVCGVSAVGCNLLAVMMGWDKAILQKRWRNVDGDWAWRGIVW